MENLQIFNHDEFGRVRTIEINGQVYFVGTDVTKALGYRNGSRDIKRHVDKKDVLKRYPLLTNGGIQQVNLISESGLYSLIFSSKLEKAKVFKHWVTSEVLPTIRKTGGYGQQKCIDCRIFEKLSTPENVNIYLTDCKISVELNEKPLKNKASEPAYKGVEKMNNNSVKKKVSISQLKAGKIWTNWTYITKNGKKTKLPTAKVNDPNTWITYAEAESNAEWGNSGVGVMFAKNRSGLALCGIDIDAHHVDTNPLTKEILDIFSDTYIEKSPSGKGYHVLFFAELNKLPTPQEYKDRYKQKNSELDVECYVSGMTNRYFTFTGNQTSKDDYVADMTEILLKFLEKYMKKSPPVSLESSDQMKLVEEREDKAAIDIASRLDIAMHANNGELFTSLYNGSTEGYNSYSEAVQAFVDILVFYFGDGGESLVKTVYMGSGMAVGKWAERDAIIDTTISNAFQRVSERYQSKKIKSKLTREEEAAPEKKKKQIITYDLFAEFLKKQEYVIKYNVISHNFEFFGFDERESKEHLAETVPTTLQDQLKLMYTHVSKQIILDYITKYATQHRYNPILELIQSVKWDGKDRVGQVYDTFKIPADTKEGIYSRIFIQKWLMQCVCGLFNDIENPFSLDIILVFQGKQGAGKTRFFEMLALKSQYFGEGICLDPRDKDSIMQATSKWISELGELGSTMRKDMDSVKAFLTKATDEYRTPYGKASLHYPRITSFVGTVNDEQFLIDQTGNRRFVTIPLPADLVIDYNTQIKPFDALQLWAQVYELVKDKEKSSCFRLTEEEKRYLEIRNSVFVKPMKGEQEVLDMLQQAQIPEQGYICTTKEMTVTEFIQHSDILKKFDANIVGKVLKKYGYEPKKKKMNGKVIQIIELPYKKWQGNT